MKELYQNQTFHYTRSISPKRVTRLRCPSPRYSVKATQLCVSGGEPFATMCKITKISLDWFAF